MSYNPANPFSIQFSGGNRSYNKVGDAKQTTFNQVFNPFYVADAITGQWQPITTSADGSLRVDVGSGITVNATFTGGPVTIQNTAPIPVSGVVQATVVIPTYQKVSSSGYVSTFSPLSGPCFVNKINGISKTSAQPSWIQVYDGPTGAGNFPVASVSVGTNNNWFLDLAENGVAFANGLTLVNSLDGVTINQSGLGADFFATVVYR